MQRTIRDTMRVYSRDFGVQVHSEDLFAFRYENGDQITMENRGDCLVVSLSCFWPEYELDRVIENMLQLVSYKIALEFQIQAGMKGNNCVVLNIFLTGPEVSLQRLDTAIQRLNKLNQDLRNIIGNRV